MRGTMFPLFLYKNMSEKKIWDKTNQWTEELETLKVIIEKTDLVATTKWGTAVYTYNKKNIIGIGGFKSYFGLWFFNGVFLKDKKKRLINAQEGKTKLQRQMRFQSKDEIDEKMILAYIKEAIAIEEKGLIIKMEKQNFKSEELEKELEANPALKKAFHLFTQYKQNEFIE